MVATISTFGSGFDGGYYLQPAVNDYYVGEEQHRGEWIGDLATQLGLGKAVDGEHFRRLVAGQHPTKRTRIIKGNTKDRVACIDITFSAPKSVSVFWAAADRETKTVVEDAVKVATRQTINFVEENLFTARRGKGGAVWEHGKIIAALFPHVINREGEPDLHVHTVLPNLVRTSDDRIRSLNSLELFSWTRTLGPMFRANLGHELDRRLGIELEQGRDAKGELREWFEVKGVPKALRDAWSTRRKQIEELLLDPDMASARDRQQANLESRESKKKLPHVNELFASWQVTARQHGFGMLETQQLLGRTAQAPKQEVDLPRLVNEVVTDLTRQEAHFQYRDLLRAVIEKLQHVAISAKEITDRLNGEIQRNRHLLTLEGEGTNRRFTSMETWKLEQAFLRHVDRLRNRDGAHVSTRHLHEVVAERPTLGEDQKKVLHDLAQGTGSIRLLRGVAGAGKSYTLDAVREAFSRAGYRVIGGALAAVAKDNLENEANIPSRTVASYLHEFDKEDSKTFVTRIIDELKRIVRGQRDQEHINEATLNSSTVLVLDEAGMLDTRSLTRILKHASRARATVILVGDDKQLQPIEAGGPFHHLLKSMPAAELTTNRRQRQEHDKAAVADLRKGNAAEALKNFHERGLLTVAPTRVETIRTLIDSWVEAEAPLWPHQHAIFTETRSDAALINKLCQRARLEATNSNHGPSLSAGTDRFHVGDRVLFHKADRSRGIENGYRGTVVTVDVLRRRLTVRLDQPKAGRSPIVHVPQNLLAPDAVTLGYASTTHKMQGQTIDHSYVLLGGRMSDRNMAYTQLTRGKESNRLFIDEQSAGPEFENIARRLSRERAKTLAHEHAHDSKREQSLSLHL